MKPVKVIEESNQYLISVADYIYRLSTQYSVNKMDRDLLEHYADEILGIQKNLENMKNNWIWKQEMEKKMDEEQIEKDIKQKKNNEDNKKKKTDEKIKEKI